MLVHEALVQAGREDLIGYDKHCLIRPKGGQRTGKMPGEPVRRSQTTKGKSKGKSKPEFSKTTSGKERSPKKKSGWAVAKPNPSKKKRSGRK